ncbi:MAG: ribonuclease HI family protein [Candidatus Krumholzibacteria bacterium]
MPRGDGPATDPLIGLLQALQDGAGIDGALQRAGLDAASALDLLDSLKERVAACTVRSSGAAPRPGRLIAYSDGASRGNPGPAACAVIVTDGAGEELLRRSKRLGVATNNVAEYQGVRLALELFKELGADDVVVKLDSELVVKQLNNEFKVKHPSLKPLFEQTRALMREISAVKIQYIPRAENKAADRLANDALDGKA